MDNKLFEFDANKRDSYKINLSSKIINTKEDSQVTVYHECDLSEEIAGPALVEFDYTSVLIPEGFTSKIMDDGLLSIMKNK